MFATSVGEDQVELRRGSKVIRRNSLAQSSCIQPDTSRTRNIISTSRPTLILRLQVFNKYQLSELKLDF
ncbi:hypothetical protein OUZ56_025130 [Daphnia magna]|uniref:Uncharacterized protein n=1 Tax=Daphnia magna TaxID=35525 RepID=A0ABQ9ZJY8_9CRUS|nr:hypothetical protein OUZ56_025130 [Daphnia magna]